MNTRKRNKETTNPTNSNKGETETRNENKEKQRMETDREQIIQNNIPKKKHETQGMNQGTRNETRTQTLCLKQRTHT